MEQTQGPERKRRTVSRASRLKKRKARLNFLIMLGIAAAVVLIILITPKEPLRRATYTVATENGETGEPVNEVVGAYEGLVISEIMPANSAAVTDENGNYGDWVEIWNSTNREINLEGIGLSDRGDSIRFLFPNVSLAPDGRAVVFCDNTNLSQAGKIFHAKFKLSSVGETVYLYDPSAYLIDSCKYPVMSSDESWSLTEDGWRSVTWFSPWYENTPEGNLHYRESISVADGALVINEVMADPLSGLRDDDDELCDWIELYNTTDRVIQLDQYGLSDNERKPLKWRFPDGAVIQPHGYYLVLCTGKNRMDTARNGVPHTNFRLSAEKETIVLTDSRGRVLDRVMIDNLPEDCSYGRNDQGTMQTFESPTPTLPNNESGFLQMDINLRAMNHTGIYLSEILASNDSIATYQKAGFTDWIEIYNSTAETVDLSGWGLSDRLSRPRKWQFPAGTSIAPGEYKVILCDRHPEKSVTGECHAGFKISRTERETIVLSDAGGRILDKISLPEMKTDVSYGRTLGMAGLFYYDTPTPFSANQNGFTGFAAKPSFSIEPGLYYSTTYVQINVPEGTQVFYTTDSTTPTQNSTPYNGEQLELNFTSVIRARAFSAAGLRPSDVLTGTYFINAYHKLPVVSVVTDPVNLWDEQNGMLTVGKNVVKEAGKLPFPNTVYRKVKDSGARAECYVEMYDESGNPLISQGAEFSLMGDFSLDMPQKSMKFRAKSKYGKKTFAAPLFPDRPYMEYKSFVLRNSGNDSMWTRVQDGFQSRLMDATGATVAHLAWKPYAVYLNGIYWGHMNLRERTDRFMLAQHEGLTFEDAQNVDLLQGNGSVKYGSNKAYKAMIKKIKAGNPAKNPEDLQYILDNVDVDNLFEYLAYEMFFGNSDIGNTRFYRFKTEGSKWKWVLYDVDYGLYSSSFDSPKSYTKAKGMGQKLIDNTIFLKLLSVPEYRDKYLTVYGNLFKQLTTDFMLSVLDELVAQITPEMPLHWARWGEENDPMVIAEVPTSVDGAYRYWEKRVERLRNVVRLRPTRLWEYTQNAFNLTDSEMIHYFGPQPEMPPEAIP